MAQFENYRGTQNLPGVRRPQVVADTAVGQATQGLGQQIQRTGAQVGRLAQLAQARNQRIAETQATGRALDLQRQADELLVQSQDSMQPGGIGFSKNYRANFDKLADDALADVPAEARTKMENDIQRVRNQRFGQADRIELEAGYKHSNTILTEFEDDLYKNVAGDPDQYEDYLTLGEQKIRESALTPSMQENRILLFRNNMAKVRLGQEPAEVQVKLLSPAIDTGSLIREKEGFRAKAYADTGGHDGKQFSGWRVGYGSDTVTKADGSIEKVTKDTVITQADAERDLQRRLVEFEGIAVKTVGTDAWQRLPSQAQAALVSVVYNYGELPGRLHAVVKSGNLEQIATAVENLRNDNGGVNSKRRQHEAAIIRGEAFIPKGDVPEDYRQMMDDLSYSDQIALYDQAQRDLAGISANRQDYFDKLIVQAPETPNLREMIRNDPQLDDGQKATLERSHNTALNAKKSEREALEWLSHNELGNPRDPNHRKHSDKLFNALVDDGEDPDKAMEAIVSRKGVYAKTYVNGILNGLASRDPSQVALAYQRAWNAYQRHPQAVDGAQNGAKIAEAAGRWQFRIEDIGLLPEQAAAQLAALNDPEQRKANEALRESKEFKDIVKQVDVAFVEKQMAHWVKSIPAVGGVLGAVGNATGVAVSPSLGDTPQMASLGVQDFRELVEEGLVLEDGDKDAAIAWATERFQRAWQVSEFYLGGDDVLVKYPAEVLNRPVNGSWEYLHTQAVEALKEEENTDYQSYWFEHVWDPATGRDVTMAEMRAGRVPAMVLKYRDMAGDEQFVPVAFRGDPKAAQAELDADRQLENDRETSLKKARVEFKESQRAYQEALSTDLQDPNREPIIKAAYERLEAARAAYSETHTRIKSERRQEQSPRRQEQLDEWAKEYPLPRTSPLDSVRQQSEQIKREKGM